MLLGIEVLDRLEVEKTINGLLVERVVVLRLDPAVLVAPLRHDDREGDVGDDHAGGERAEVPGILAEEVGRNEPHLRCIAIGVQSTAEDERYCSPARSTKGRSSSAAQARATFECAHWARLEEDGKDLERDVPKEVAICSSFITIVGMTQQK